MACELSGGMLGRSMLRNDNCLRGVSRTLDAVGVLAGDRVAEIDEVINREVRVPFLRQARVRAPTIAHYRRFRLTEARGARVAERTRPHRRSLDFRDLSSCESPTRKYCRSWRPKNRRSHATATRPGQKGSRSDNVEITNMGQFSEYSFHHRAQAD